MTESQHLHALCSGFHPPDCMWLEPRRPLSWRNVKTVLNYWTRVNSKRTLVTRRLLGPRGFCTMVESRLLTCQWPARSPTFTDLLCHHTCAAGPGGVWVHPFTTCPKQWLCLSPAIPSQGGKEGSTHRMTHQRQVIPGVSPLLSVLRMYLAAVLGYS